MIKFYYRDVKSPVFEKIKRPFANICIQSRSGKWIQFRPLIDSGADITLIPHSLGVYLGFEMEDKIVEFGGVTGRHLPVIIKKIKIKIGDIESEPRVAWSLIEEAPPILGRLDIFNKFEITFKEDEGWVEFNPL
jgi:hypothetical protein